MDVSDNVFVVGGLQQCGTRHRLAQLHQYRDSGVQAPDLFLETDEVQGGMLGSGDGKLAREGLHGLHHVRTQPLSRRGAGTVTGA